MSKDIIVLTPNGRRQKVHCTPDTTMLQVLEDACEKHGFQPTEYDLKHHNHILDLTTTMRFSNLPNKAMLEMVEAERQRAETNVTVGLVLEDGERRTADFPPNTSLLDMIITLAPSEFRTLQNPMIMYMRQEVSGVNALKEKTLRKLGLLGGRAILRLLNKADEPTQANVSSVYRAPATAKPLKESAPKQEDPKSAVTSNNQDNPRPGTSTDFFTTRKFTDDIKPIDPRKLMNEVKKEFAEKEKLKQLKIDESKVTSDIAAPMEADETEPITTKSSNSFFQDNLERRLNIEEEVTFLGAQKAVAFLQPDERQEEFDDLPDDFYELTIEEVRKLYKELQDQRMELEEMPLLTASAKESISNQTSQLSVAGYKNAVVRIQFPDNIVLQGVFAPTNTIQDIYNFIKEHLNEPNRPFHIFTTPLKETLNPRLSLLEAKFVPCVHMHFKWANETISRGPQKYLKDEIYAKRTSSDAASLLASKYRAPSRRKQETAHYTNAASSSRAKNSKMPKWFKR